jgi:type IV secretion system protein VirB6
MAELCIGPPDGVGFLSGALDFIDCQAQSIGEAGYLVLAQPGSTAALLLTALFTIFIALFGIRLLLGRPLAISDVVMAAIKLGIVLMLATSWAGFRITAYDLVLKAPAELTEAIGGAASLPGATGGLSGRLQGVDNAILLLIDSGSGRLDPTAIRQTVPSAGPPLASAPLSDDLALGMGRVVFLSTVIGGLGLTRLAAGFLLALAPLFAGFLLFDATRSLFTGWVRMLAALLLAAFAVTMTLAVELAALEPWLAQVLAQRASRFITPAAPVELLVIALAFAIVAFGMIAVAFKITFVPLLTQLTASSRHDAKDTSLGVMAGRVEVRAGTTPILAGTSRARAIAGSVSTQQRYEQNLMSTSGDDTQPVAVAGRRVADVARTAALTPAMPLGRQYPVGNRNARRVSQAATQRSRRS